MEDKRTTEQDRQNGAGRISLDEKDCYDEQGNLIKTSGRDISEIDCQEGTMHHGVLGGNFEESEEYENSKQKS